MKKTKTAKFDISDHLKTEADCAAYLNACLEEGGQDAAYMAAALGDIARAKGMSKVARSAKLSRESLYKGLSGKSATSLDTFLRVAKALGMRMTFEPAHAHSHA